MECVKDIRTGIVRHSYDTVYPKEFKQILAESGLVERCTVNGVEVNPKKVSPSDEAIYDIAFRRDRFHVISTGTRVIFVGTNDRKMLELYKALHGEEWEYDFSNKFDYVGGR